MYLLFALACLYIALQIPPLIPFSNIISISLSVNNSNFTLVFLSMSSKTISEQIKNALNQVYIFQGIYI